MTLFAALTAKDGDATSTGTPSSSSSPPEAIQLHSSRVIDFLSGTTVHLATDSSKSNGDDGKEASAANSSSGEGQSRYFSALSYQAIQTQQDDPLPGKSGGQRHVRPDLGVWDCRVNGADAETPAMLLKRVVMEKKADTGLAGEEKKDAGEAGSVDKNDETSAPPIVMAVDFSNPGEVQPVIERMRSVVLGIYDDKDKATTLANPQSCTTTTKALEKTTFGTTLIQEEVTVKGGSSSTEQRIALILAVIVPSTINTASTTSAADEYKERQARALLLYHLHKFALEVNCTLCFVSEKASSVSDVLGDAGGEEKKSDAIAENDPLLGRNTTMSIEELGKVIRRVAMGLSPVEQSDVMEQAKEEDKGESKDESKEENDETSQRAPSIHAPGSHDAELIHGAYLRNASCEGRWDASKDDLTVALPPRSASAPKDKDAKEENNANNGDEEWLSQLASSIGLSPDAATASTASGGALTPTGEERRERMKKEKSMKKRPTRSTLSRNKDAKPKDEKEVMNFFDNLLKK